MSAKAGRHDDQYMVRFPPGLRDKIKEAASESGRSMNSEIVARLEDTFTIVPKLENVIAREDDLKQQITEMQADLTAFMIMQGQDPAEVRKHWEDAARKMRAERAAKKP